MKWLLIFFSIIKPFFSQENQSINPATEIKDFIRANAMKVVMLFTAAISLGILFSSGLVLIAVDMGAQYDQNGYIYFSSMIIMGLILSALSLVSGAIVVKSFQDTTQSRRHKNPPLTAVGTSHPLQDALALLIIDFVKERELKRASDMNPMTNNQEHNQTAEDMRH